MTDFEDFVEATRGEVELSAPMRRYVPELRLADESVAARITVLQLLDHTSGLGLGGVVVTDDGDDALARYVGSLADLDLVAAPGPPTARPGTTWWGGSWRT